MKYIRTEDNIYKVSQGIFGDYPIDRKGNVLKMPLPTVIKSADTIEELCDEVVAIIKHNNQFLTKEEIYHEQWHNFADLKTNIEERFDIQNYLKCYETLVAIYGAIWTDKGLIFVAKMNEKGDLELL